MRRLVGLAASCAMVMGALALAPPAAADTGPVATDSFGRADAATLGTADSGQAWASHSGAFSVASGQALAGDGYGLTTLDVGSGPATVGVTVTSPRDEFWLIVRFEDAANFWRFGRWRGEGYQLQQIRNNGLGSPALTALGSASAAAGDRLECRTGTLLSCSVNGEPIVRTDDTFAASATRYGISTYNSASARFDDFSVQPSPVLADLSTSVSAPSLVPSGAALEASSTVVNSGPATARDVVLEWTVSAGVTSLAGTGPSGACTTSGSVVRCPVGDVASGATATASLSATTPAGSGSVRLDVRALQAAADAHPSDDATHTSVTLRPDLSPDTVVSDAFGRADRPSLGSTDTGQPWTNHHGQAYVQNNKAVVDSGYSLSTVESGQAQGLVGATVSATGPEFWLVLRLSSANDYWRFGRSGDGAYQLQQIRNNGLGSPVLDRRATVQPEAGDRLECRLTDEFISCSVDGQVVVRTSDSFNSTATRHGLGGYTGTASRIDDFLVEKAVPRPDLRVTADAPSLVASSSSMSLTATARNRGQVPATGSTVELTLPAGATATGAQSSSGSCTTTSTEVVCQIGTVAPGATVTVTVSATAPSALGSVSTTARASSQQPDRDTDDNSASAPSVVYDASKPRPIVVDSFGRPDASSLGSADTGQAWQALSGSPGIQSGKASPGSGFGFATVESGTADGVVTATLTTPGTEFWLIVRAAGSSDYWRFGRARGEAYQLQLIRNNGLGSPALTPLGTVQPAAGDHIECRASAGIRCSVNGTDVVRTSDTTHSTATRHGLATWNSPEVRFDAFGVSELARVADLSVSLSGTRSVTTSGAISLQANVFNAGTSAAAGSAIDGTVGAGIAVGSVTGPSGACAVNGRAFHCSLGSIAPGADASVTITGTAPTQAGPVTSVVRVSHGGADAETGNDEASLTTTVRLPAPPGAVVTDGFDRAAPAGGGLGTADSGEPWQPVQGNLSILGGEVGSTTAATSMAVVDTGFSFGTYEVTIADGASAPFWLAFRVVDANNYFKLGTDQWSGNYKLSKVIGGVESSMAINFTRAYVQPHNGDVVRLVLRPDDGVYVYVNGEQIIDAGDTQLMDVTSFGLGTRSTAPRFDGLQISSTMEAFPVSDTFSRADAETLGTAEVGSRYPWRSWEGPSWAVSSGRARYSSTGFGLTAIDASTEMAGVRATFAVTGDEQWLVFRYGEDGSYYRFGAEASGQYRVDFVRDGSTVARPVPVQVVTSRHIAAGDVVEVVQRLGGVVETRVNGTVTHRFTDPTTNARATIYGLATSGMTARFDNVAITLPPR